ncbi:MAG: crossover junction endodeoxyribonuclease RuvC [Synergistaceae bacterium]|nr:crossover junction endodeoxyribonuclease RuvC [Synergistaceae bacterium]
MQSSEPGLVCLGVDPGLARLGYGLVRQSGMVVRALAYGCVETGPEMPFTQRLLCLYDALGEQVENRSPDFMCVERLFFGRNSTTAEYVWQARGVVMLLAAQRGLSVLEPKPSQVKMAVCGTGTADKTQIQRMIQRLLSLDAIPRPDDAADALAVALTGLAFYRHEQRIRRAACP